jgi:hypothetical protein
LWSKHRKDSIFYVAAQINATEEGKYANFIIFRQPSSLQMRYKQYFGQFLKRMTEEMRKLVKLINLLISKEKDNFFHCELGTARPLRIFLTMNRMPVRQVRFAEGHDLYTGSIADTKNKLLGAAEHSFPLISNNSLTLNEHDFKDFLKMVKEFTC